MNLNNDQIAKLFHLASLEIPSEIGVNDINRALIEVEKQMLSSSCVASQITLANPVSVLIIDDLEITIHQLSLLLTKSGYNVCIARSSKEAVDLFKKRKYEYVLLDLFLPDPEDGIDLLTEFKEQEKTRLDDTKIVVISGTDNKKLINECFLKGADEFIGKDPDWHKNILKYINMLEKQKKRLDKDVITDIEDEEKKITNISITNFHKDNVIQKLEQEIMSQLNLGYSNIIIDMDNVYTLNSRSIGILISGYKHCSEKGGNLKLYNVKNSVNELLTYVYLNNVLPVYNNKQAALTSFS